jgi:hypothetical protein
MKRAFSTLRHSRFDSRKARAAEREEARGFEGIGALNLNGNFIAGFRNYFSHGPWDDDLRGGKTVSGSEQSHCGFRV